MKRGKQAEAGAIHAFTLSLSQRGPNSPTQVAPQLLDQ
jgi:hypothetical protein